MPGTALHMNEEKANDSLSPKNWVKRYADDFFRFAMTRVSDKILAQDLVQDTFLSALQSAAQFKGQSSERNWLMAILKNKIIDHYRRQGKVGTLVSLDDGDSFFDEKGHWRKDAAPQQWPDSWQAPGEQTEFLRVLQECIHKLNGMGQAVVNLKYLQEKNSKEICKELSITASNYWVLMHRAKLHLRSCLDKNWLK
ncbi:RNA polymerase sigma-70 factor, ECF subfamily [Chitinophaga jiangningensis]|uniref:RNA polymerase sigma-70 factor, ECF subfamily n=1 Tax=Chitinophaga jiangningensis TaxID=1419482 RepID=A0A1M7CPR4_9BACT|nr:sigma-70 family RNA polymerase sigma factor [Chitinophaga jiangningensis]SHL69130.1 RNA polymerase sigma-70 factor, ECF subfamily [Chitinophaga jiangningensis]